MPINHLSNINTQIQTPSENIITPDMAALKGLLAGQSSAEALMGKKAQAAAYAQANKDKTASFADRNGINVGKDYETRMDPYKKTNEDIARIESILNTKDKQGRPLITAQQVGDANAAIARVFSPGHMSDATVNRTEYESMPAAFAKAAQKLTADPTDVGSRSLIEHVIDQAHHIGNVNNSNALKELGSLDAGSQALSEDAVKKLAQQKSDFYKSRFGTNYPEQGAHPVAASANAPGSTAVSDMGHTVSKAGHGILDGLKNFLSGGSKDDSTSMAQPQPQAAPQQQQQPAAPPPTPQVAPQSAAPPAPRGTSPQAPAATTYDGSTPPDPSMGPEAKQIRIKYLQKKAAGGQ